MQDKTKSFLKGLASGVGASLLTALVAVTIYGCANSGSKGVKAFGANEINFIGISEDEGDTYVYSEASFDYEWQVSPSCGLGFVDFSNPYYQEVVNTELQLGINGTPLADQVVVTFGDVYVNGILNVFANINTSRLSPAVIGSIALSAEYLDGDNVMRNTGDGSYIVPLPDLPHYGSAVISVRVGWGVSSSNWVRVVNQPLSPNQDQYSSEMASYNPYVSFDFSGGMYPVSVFPQVQYGNMGYDVSLPRGRKNVYVNATINYGGYLWDWLLFSYYDVYQGNNTYYTTADGTSVLFGSGVETSKGFFYCHDVQLGRRVSFGQSYYDVYETILTCPQETTDGLGTAIQDTRLSWVKWDKVFPVLETDLSGVPQGFWDNTISQGRFLEIIGGKPYSQPVWSGGGSSAGDVDGFGDVFGLIGQAFEGASVIFNMQIFPFATLGMFLLIPLVVGIVLFVVGLFKR